MRRLADQLVSIGRQIGTTGDQIHSKAGRIEFEGAGRAPVPRLGRRPSARTRRSSSTSSTTSPSYLRREAEQLDERARPGAACELPDERDQGRVRGRRRSIGLRNACKDAEAKYDLPEGTLLAIASRETNMRNITGDGGHGRGVFQIDDRWHADWLRKHGAGGPGQVPPVRDAAFYAASIIAANLDAAKDAGVPKEERMRVALAGYNAGLERRDRRLARAATPTRAPPAATTAATSCSAARVVRDLLPDDGDKDKDNGKAPTTARAPASRSRSPSPTGGVQAPTGRRREIVINPEHLRSMAALLDRADDEFKDFAHKLATLRKPNDARTHVRAPRRGRDRRASTCACARSPRPRTSWASDLRKRASRVDEPAGAGKGKGKHEPGQAPQPARDRQPGPAGAHAAAAAEQAGLRPARRSTAQFGPLTQAALKRFQAKKHLAGQRRRRRQDVGGAARPPDHDQGSRPAAEAAVVGGGPLPEGLPRRPGEARSAPRSARSTSPATTSPTSTRAGTRARRRGLVRGLRLLGVRARPGTDRSAAKARRVSQWRDYFQAKGDWHTQAPRVGAVVCFDWKNGGQTTDHVGIVSRIENGRVYYISGNTSNPGGRRRRRLREVGPDGQRPRVRVDVTLTELRVTAAGLDDGDARRPGRARAPARRAGRRPGPARARPARRRRPDRGRPGVVRSRCASPPTCSGSSAASPASRPRSRST